MKRAKKAAKTESQKASIGQLKEMALEDYTKLLARNMVETLNAQTKRRGASRDSRRAKGK